MTESDDGITIRPLLASDSLDELTELLHRAYARLAAMDLRFMATHQSVAVTRERAGLGECFVALDDGRLCGTILLRDAGQTGGCPWYNRPDVAAFGQFAVDPNLQAKGLGRRMVSVVEARARERGVGELALDTAEPATHLIEWYARLGYRHVEFADWKHTNYRSVIMSKTL